MLRRLTIDHVGPTDHLEADFGSRLNILTGDNSLGKSFLLDVVYWSLTKGQGRDPLPVPPTKGKPRIESLRGGRDSRPEVGEYSSSSQSWTICGTDKPQLPELIFYSGSQGEVRLSHSPLYREAWLVGTGHFHFDHMFSTENIRDGLRSPDGKHPVCNGLVVDWTLWQNSRDGTRESALFNALKECAKAICDPDDQITFDVPQKVFLEDSRQFPTLSIRGTLSPEPTWSASLKRVLGWAYLLVWSWYEVQQNCRLMGRSPTGGIILIIDEIETHLHPTWQRRILPALLEVVKALAPEANVQLFVTTHSPLVLASLEPLFDPDQDRLFHFEQTDHGVEFETLPWANHGDAANWLTSPVFGLSQARSVEAEKAVSDAQKFMLSDRSDATRHVEIHGRLRRLLTPEDRYWNRWVAPK